MIFDIKRYSINDGPGIRVTVFFKGCPLNCAWCHNPESISTNVQKMYNRDKCMGCGGCVQFCPEQVCERTPEGIVTRRDRCSGCGRCADICPTRATEMSGRAATVEEIVEAVEKERIFFDQSGGGVTFSGGEPLLQPEFLISLLREFGSRSIHRAVDTTGFARTETLLEVAKHTDHFLYDIKLMDSTKHKKWTGVDNKKILNNLKALAETGASINIRVPLVKGVNDDIPNISRTASFVAALPGEKKKVNVLPYHNIMIAKHRKLGSSFSAQEMAEPTAEELENIINIFTEQGLAVQTGG
ncbi:glycyl-radical enzyme activating protein [Desulforhopalus singaporensis]|nr:glycyl-radical enzyme activating protein [Desulforhopalus singaporensis]